METRERIVDAAARLLAEGGRDAVSTRAVAGAAGVQAPTMYRLFGDKQGLLDAVAEHGYAAYLADKLADRTGAPRPADPVEELRQGWDAHVEFGLSHPALYVLMVEPRRDGASPAALAGIAHLRALVGRIAEAGRLAVPVERAMRVVHAAGVGATLTALGEVEPDRAVLRTVRDACIAAVTTDAPAAADPGAGPAAVALRSRLGDLDLSPGERALLGELLDRIADPGDHRGA